MDVKIDKWQSFAHVKISETKLILREIVDMTYEEKELVFSNLEKDISEYWIIGDSCDDLSAVNCEGVLVLYWINRNNKEDMSNFTICPLNICDYLRLINIDIDNLIQQGKAVNEKSLKL